MGYGRSRRHGSALYRAARSSSAPGDLPCLVAAAQDGTLADDGGLRWPWTKTGRISSTGIRSRAASPWHPTLAGQQPLASSPVPRPCTYVPARTRSTPCPRQCRSSACGVARSAGTGRPGPHTWAAGTCGPCTCRRSGPAATGGPHARTRVGRPSTRDRSCPLHAAPRRQRPRHGARGMRGAAKRV